MIIPNHYHHIIYNYIHSTIIIRNNTFAFAALNHPARMARKARLHTAAVTAPAAFIDLGAELTENPDLYMGVCPSVRRSVGPSDGWSDGNKFF